MHQGLENGRNLLMNLNTSTGGHDNSLAAELEAMSNDEVCLIITRWRGGFINHNTTYKLICSITHIVRLISLMVS